MFTAVVVATDRLEDLDRAWALGTLLAQRAAIPVEELRITDERDVAPAIAEHVGERDGALLVMATDTRDDVTRGSRRSIATDVLAAIRQPVLLLGPEVRVDRSFGSPTPVVCTTDRSSAAPRSRSSPPGRGRSEEPDHGSSRLSRKQPGLKVERRPGPSGTMSMPPHGC